MNKKHLFKALRVLPCLLCFVIISMGLQPHSAYAQVNAQNNFPAEPQTGIATTNPLWVKLCSEAAGANGEVVNASNQVCLLAHHERLDKITGMVLVSAAIRKIPDFDKQLLVIMVPLGMAIRPGLTVKFDGQGEGIQVPYATCHFAGCTAEMIATDAIIQKMKTGAKMSVTAINQNGKPLLFPVPLTGFTKAYQGPAIDMQKYSEERRTLIKQLREPLYSQGQHYSQTTPLVR